MIEKVETILITVAILEGRHYIWTNMDSAVIVKVDKKKRCTAVKRSTDYPIYNEYFVFEFTTTLEGILEKTITITVIQPRNACRKRKILGNFTLDVATLWSQENHQFYHKWAILSKSDNSVGPRGYLKIDICVISKGQISEIPPDVGNDDEIEGNLLLPVDTYHERQKAFYVFDVYKCISLIEKPMLTINDNKTSGSAPNTYVEITFSGQKVRTSTKKNTHSPVFNERLTIMDMFPPLCQRIKIEICYPECCKKTVTAARYLDLKLISNDKEEGFLPTFGPTYLHIYFNNSLGGFSGKIFIGMNTELQELLPTDAKTAGTLIQSISPIPELEQTDEVILFGMLFSATAIARRWCDKAVSFRMTFGSTLLQKNPAASGENVPMNATMSMKPKRVSKEYYYMPFENEKPSMVITRRLPSCRKRMYNSNILYKISKELKMRLKSIEEQFEVRCYKGTCQTLNQTLADTFDFITASGKKYIDIVEEYNIECITKLDNERKKMCLKEMANVLEKVEKIAEEGTQFETLGKLQRLCDRIEALIFDIQECWPDLHLWMIFGNRKVAYCQMPARDIIFSPIEEEKGEYCGKMMTVFLYPHPKDRINFSCKMDLMLWLGLERYKDNCFNSIPPGYKFQKETLFTSRKIQAEEKYDFYLRAHIFQGKINPGFDKTGLADTFVRVVIRDKQRETRIISTKLNPTWDQTLILPNIILYGSKSYLKNNIPNILVEIWDQDKCEKDNLVGRTLVTPIIKFRDDPYSPPTFPPKLSWHKTFLGAEVLGEILAAFEFIETPERGDDFQLPPVEKIYHIPDDVRPQMVPYKLEVMFWGVRHLRKLYLVQINRPRISVICEEKLLISDTIENAKKNPNFLRKCKSMDVIIPLETVYTPPLCLKMHDSRRFGVYAYAGVCIADVHSFMYYPLTSQERNKRLSQCSLVKPLPTQFQKGNIGKFGHENHLEILEEEKPKTDSPSLCKKCFKNLPNIRESMCSLKKIELTKQKAFGCSRLTNWFKNACELTKIDFCRKIRKEPSLGTYELLPEYEDNDDDDDFDWWTKFYASLDKTHTDNVSPQENENETIEDPRKTLKIYFRELELQSEFDGFTDMFKTFEIYKGKRTGDEVVDEENITGVFKGAVRIYRWPPEIEGDYVTDRGLPLKDGIFQNYPDNLPVRFLLRVYCVRGLGLRPKDTGSKSDPYLHLTLNNNVISDRENYTPRQVNPIFGRVFEFNGNFPSDHTLIVSVWDYDNASRDDLIGETRIDIENRFYSKHRAFCAIADHYTESGYCAWRGRQKPVTILAELCRTWGVENPEYEEDSVRVGTKRFITDDFIPSGSLEFDKEVLALTVLRRWQEMPVIGFPIVPEHVETRSLYDSSKPGIEQGKIQLWIDVFPITDLPPPKSVVITPQKPVKYELRVIIWNTEDITLDEDDYFLGERKSDIYIKGWLTDSRDSQYTDVHYRSLSGEGNFNWRFVFPFEYLSTENKLVMRVKESIFVSDDTEFKIPCRLTLQVWDNDTFSTDDFIGTLDLELSKMSRGARSADMCSLSLLEPSAPRINLFKTRRTRGWWPFKRFDEKLEQYSLRGKVEAELEIITTEEAKTTPAGLGRKDPQGLSPPRRPDVSFSWFRNPLKALKYVICKYHRWTLIKIFIFIMLVVLILVGVYSFPGYAIKGILGV